MKTARCPPPSPPRSACPSPDNASRLTRRRPSTTAFQRAVRTILPGLSISRGNPTLPESNRPLCAASGIGEGVAALEHPLGVQAWVDPVLLDALARLERKLLVVEENVDHVRLEGDEIGDARDLGPRLQVRPRGPLALADVVVTGEALVGAERLPLDGNERALVDVLARHVPARRETGLVEHERPLGVGDNPRAVLDDQVARALADVVAVILIGGVTDDALVLLVEAVHRPPGERDAAAELAGVVGRGGVVPCAPGLAPVADGHGEPLGIAEGGGPRVRFLADEYAGPNVAQREVRDRVAAGLVEQEHAFAVGDPLLGELDSEPSTKGLGEKQPFRERLGREESAHPDAGPRGLLQGQTHARVPSLLGGARRTNAVPRKTTITNVVTYWRERAPGPCPTGRGALQRRAAPQPRALEKDRGHGKGEQNDLDAQQLQRLLGRAVDRDADEPRDGDHADGGREHGQAGQQSLSGKEAAEQDQRQRERKSAESDPHAADRHHRPEYDRVGGRLVDGVAKVPEADEGEQHRGEQQQDTRQPRGGTPEQVHISSEMTLE